MVVQWFRAWQQVRGRRQTPARRWLAVLLVLAVAASAVLNVTAGDQASLAASAAHEHSVDHHGADDPCCPDQKSHTQDGICASAGGCSLWMAASPMPSFVPPDGESVQAEPAAAGSGAVPFPHFHPPKLSARV
ncbi:MAG: hypothetical protein BroJett029_05310 [Alphaproteobacteria bacterium]|nr:MAG: hypothetical protein BroJett029_05310 [Alphaproteobacteria bacterium]